MNFILSFLLNNKSLSVIAFLLTIIAGQSVYIYIEKQKIIAAVAEKETAETKLTVCKGSVKELQNSIETQNAAIEKLKSDAQKREKDHKAEVDKAKTQAENYRKQAEDLMKRQPPQNVDKCNAANQLINEEVARVK